MSKFTKLTAEITVAACTKAQDYNAETKARSDKKTKDGQQVFELHIPVKSKVKKGEIELEELNYEKLNSLIELPIGNHTVELDVFEMKDGKIYFRANKLVSNSAPAKKVA